MSAVKILYFIDGLIAGGKQRRLVELMKGVKLKSNIEFEIIVMSSEIHYNQVIDLGIKIHYLVRSTKNDFSVFRKFYKICKNYQPDIVHCWDSLTAAIAVPSCKILHIKLVNGLVVDTPVNQTIFDKFWLRARLTFLFSNIVIGNSNAGLKAYKAPVSRSLCIYNGMDLSRFNNLKEPALIRKEIFGEDLCGIIVIGMVAAFEERKDYETLIKAAKKLIPSETKIRFVLVGNGPTFEKIRSEVSGSLSDKIIFLGKRSDVESIVNIFDIGVLLTNTKVHGEGISNSVIEYMALSKPVIATRGGGTNEVVIDEKNGYLIDPDNEDQLIDKIRILLADKTRMDHFGERGGNMAREKFDLKIMTNHYLEMYHTLIKNKN